MYLGTYTGALKASQNLHIKKILIDQLPSLACIVERTIPCFILRLNKVQLGLAVLVETLTWSDASDDPDLAAQPGVVVGVADDHLDVRRIPILKRSYNKVAVSSLMSPHELNFWMRQM